MPLNTKNVIIDRSGRFYCGWKDNQKRWSNSLSEAVIYDDPAVASKVAKHFGPEYSIKDVTKDYKG